MADVDIKKVRNLALVGHGSAGKTSLVEHLLFAAKAIKQLGNIAAGNAVGDYLPEEISHGYTISAKLLNASWKSHRIYLIDNPGYADFFGEVVGSLSVVDAAVVVIDGVSGIEVGTDNCWKQADKRGIPRLVVINKLDKDNSDFHRILESVQNEFGQKCVPIALPVGKESGFKGIVALWNSNADPPPAEVKDEFDQYRDNLVEAVAETDDALVEKYLGGESLTPEEFKTGLKAGFSSGSLVPVLPVSVEKDLGITELLDLIVDLFPAPCDRPPFKATEDKGAEVEIPCDPAVPLAAHVFKSLSDPYVGQLSFFRVLSGVFKCDSEVYNASRKERERIGTVFVLQGKEQRNVEAVYPGELAAVAKLKNTGVGDTLCTRDRVVIFPKIQYPTPMVKLAIQPKSRKDEDKIGTALKRLSEDDPTFRDERNPETGEHLIYGMGDLHLDIIMERLRDKYGVEATTSIPKIAYKETIKSTVQVQGRYKRQSGGRGQFGDVWLELSPLPRGSGFEFVDKIVGGVVPKNYIPAVEKGAREALQRGVIAGYPVIDTRVTLYDGSFHPVDSSDLAFTIASSLAIQKGVVEAKHCMLEPVVEAEITVPEDKMGDITGDINSRRGRILGIEPGIGKQTIRVVVPEAEMLRYSTELRSRTGGRGSYTMKFSHYEELPERLAQEIITAAQKAKEAGS